MRIGSLFGFACFIKTMWFGLENCKKKLGLEIRKNMWWAAKRQ